MAFDFGDFPSFEFDTDMSDAAQYLTPALDTSSFLSNMGGFTLGGGQGDVSEPSLGWLNPSSTGGGTPRFDLGGSMGGGGFGPDVAPLSNTSSSPGWFESIFGSGGSSGKSPGWLDTLGSVAKTVAPFAALGATGAMQKSASDASARAARAEPIIRQGQETQIQSAQQQQALAPQAAALSPQIAALAPQAAALSSQVAGVAPRQGELAREFTETLAPRQSETARTLTSSVVQPQIDRATELLASARAGVLPAAEEAEITRWKAGEIQKIRDYFSRAGIGSSTMLLQAERGIEEQALAAKGQRLRAIETNAANFLSQARGGLESAGALTEGEGRLLTGAGNLNESEARILQGAAAPLGTAGNILQGAAQPIGVAGNILQGAGNTAQGAARTGMLEEAALNDLIRRAQQQLFQLTAGSAK